MFTPPDILKKIIYELNIGLLSGDDKGLSNGAFEQIHLNFMIKVYMWS
jgi:hypothetical protein